VCVFGLLLLAVSLARRISGTTAVDG